LTSTSRVRMPCSTAFFAASSAATCAAYGVDLREPLNPIMPALDHETVFPAPSVMVMIVLLKVAATCATPCTTFFFSFLRARPAPFLSAAILFGHLLLTGDRFGRALSRARVRVCPLAAHRQSSAMPKAAIAAQIHQPLDIHCDFAAQIAFDQIIAIDDLADLNDFG